MAWSMPSHLTFGRLLALGFFLATQSERFVHGLVLLGEDQAPVDVVLGLFEVLVVRDAGVPSAELVLTEARRDLAVDVAGFLG